MLAYRSNTVQYDPLVINNLYGKDNKPTPAAVACRQWKAYALGALCSCRPEGSVWCVMASLQALTAPSNALGAQSSAPAGQTTAAGKPLHFVKVQTNFSEGHTQRERERERERERNSNRPFSQPGL